MGMSDVFKGIIIGTVAGAVIVGTKLKSRPRINKNTCFEENLSLTTILDWFQQNNSNGKYTNKVIMPDQKNLERFKLSHLVEGLTDKCVIQVLLDKRTNEVMNFRIVCYDMIQDGLAELLEQSNGVAIIE